jgi:hypothetical protein
MTIVGLNPLHKFRRKSEEPPPLNPGSSPTRSSFIPIDMVVAISIAQRAVEKGKTSSPFTKNTGKPAFSEVVR